MRLAFRLALLSTLAVTAPALADGAFEHRYEVRFLKTFQAEALMKNQCPRNPDIECQIRMRGGEIFVVTAPEEVHERIQAELERRDAPPPTQSFQLILLEGRRDGKGQPGFLPPSARQALEDLADFFPFQGYELIDSAFMHTTELAEVSISGPNDHNFVARLEFTSSAHVDQRNIFVRRFVLEHERWISPPVAPSETSTQERTPATLDYETMVETSFSMSSGETVVVGTSKLDGGDRALVVLLTALP